MPKDSLKSGRCSCEASERCWDKKQPHFCASDTNHFHKKGFALLTFGTQSGILYHWSGKGTFSTIFTGKWPSKGGGDKNIAAYNFEGIFGQLSYYLKRLSYI